MNPPPISELQRPAEHESESFLDELMNSKIRRHILAPLLWMQRRESCKVVPLTVQCTSLLLSLPCQLSTNPSHKHSDFIFFFSSIVRDLAKTLDTPATFASRSVVDRADVLLHGLSYYSPSQRKRAPHNLAISRDEG